MLATFLNSTFPVHTSQRPVLMMLSGFLFLLLLKATLFSYRTEKDKTLPSFQLMVENNGTVMLRNDMVLVSTCRMHIYQFPFDVQSCTLSFKSVTHLGEPVTSSFVFI
ncbi:hypothetical protein F7725_014499 [Dissostichus mawsoni]|uniref:Neurotransmitter-gated ion-channel ligand-binding domain-containing protein n=1 Tax=Dissostichus mawsoni TaxID=36200 RepID=A0A7J5YYA8_DISMA|nr:hypothetical protein F7725_014499 [Dissostichus mawsoni]